jgi:hypothetical protein
LSWWWMLTMMWWECNGIETNHRRVGILQAYVSVR